MKTVYETWIVVEALPSAELVHICHTEKDVKNAISDLVNEYACDVKDIKVFSLNKVEAVEITL
jgi:hypothetical protein